MIIIGKYPGVGERAPKSAKHRHNRHKSWHIACPCTMLLGGSSRGVIRERGAAALDLNNNDQKYQRNKSVEWNMRQITSHPHRRKK